MYIASSRRAAGCTTCVINHPRDVKRVLLTNHRNYTKGEGMDRVKILLGNGIMTSEGDFWRRQRRMMQPCFHRRVLERFGGLIHEVNLRFAERWAARAAAGEPINLTDEVSELTLEIVLRIDLRLRPRAPREAARRQPLRGGREGNRTAI